jgi:PAS domain S-box-containing protein
MGKYLSFDAIRNQIADKLLLVGLIASIPAAFASGYRIFSLGLKVQFIVDILIAFILVAAYFTRNKTNYRKRMAFLLGYVFMLGCVSLYTWGLWGFGLFIMFFSIIITTTLFGMRYGLGLLGASLIILLLLTLSIHYQWISFQWDFNSLSHSTLQWILRAIFFIVYASITVVTLGLLHKNFEKINKELAVSEERYDLALESVNEAIWELDLKTNKAYVNPKFFDILHFASAEFAMDYKSWQRLIHPNDKELVFTKINDHLGGNTPLINIEYRMKDREGKWRWILTRGKIIRRDENFKPIRVLGTHTDIGPRKELEQILRESEERFRMLFMNANDAILLIAGGTIIDVNNSASDFFAMTKEQIIGQELSDLSYKDEEGHDCSKKLSELFNDAQNGISNKVEWELKRADGRKIDSLMSIALAYNEEKPIFQVILHDISERKQFEQVKLNAIVETEDRERLKLAGDLHDDVGPLLSSLNMYLSLLSREQTENKGEIIENMQGILKDTIKSVREISNNISPHSLNNFGLARAVRSFLDQGSKLMDITFEENLGDTRFSKIVEVMVYRIVKELFNNTIKYATAKSVRIKLNLRENLLYLSYQDDGVGFDFENVIKENQSGIGLLNLINRLKSLKAKYKFDSKPGEGMRFNMIFRLER